MLLRRGPVRWVLRAAALWGLLGLCAGCEDPQPKVCKAALECLYPGGQIPEGEAYAFLFDRYAQCLDDPYLVEGDTYPNRDATLEVFGPGGACWAFPGDLYYESCVTACENVLIEDCFLAETTALDSYCLEAIREAEIPNALTCTEFLDTPDEDYRSRARDLECRFDQSAPVQSEPDPEPDAPADAGTQPTDGGA